MTARGCAIAALALGLVAVSRAADPPAPTASVRDAIYFGSGGPVRIRFQMTIDGLPVEAAWDAAIDGLFKQCDRNGDGALDVAERVGFVPPPRSREMIVMFAGEQTPDVLRLTFNQKDEKVSRAAFAEAVRAAGKPPITLRPVAGRPDSRQLSAALFRHLDLNNDGRLSADELKAARTSLAGLDTDEDEFLTAAELLGRMTNVGRVRPVPAAMRQPAEPADPSTDFVFLTDTGGAAVKQILATRGGTRATSLKLAEFGGDAKQFAALDKDGNGILDTVELEAWLRLPPDIDMPLSFTDGGCVTPPLQKNFPGVRFAFEPTAFNAPRLWKKLSEGVLAYLKEQANASGIVEKKAIESQPLQVAFFGIADRNGDGKLDAAEVDAGLKVLAPLANCRIDIAFADQGNGLFELLDRNGDGKLSPRELVEATAVLTPFAGADKCVGPKDLIRRFIVRTEVDPIPIAVVLLTRLNSEETKPTAAPPEWFTKMDRNGDGDVSLREFVGPIELFRKLDRDGDGLISVAEANQK